MDRPKPIRYDRDTWLVMRDDNVLPKAVIKRFTDRRGVDQYVLVKWDLDPAKRTLMAVCDSLAKADKLVLYDNRNPTGSGTGHQTGTQPAKSGSVCVDVFDQFAHACDCRFSCLDARRYAPPGRERCVLKMTTTIAPAPFSILAVWAIQVGKEKIPVGGKVEYYRSSENGSYIRYGLTAPDGHVARGSWTWQGRTTIEILGIYTYLGEIERDAHTYTLLEDTPA